MRSNQKGQKSSNFTNNLFKKQLHLDINKMLRVSFNQLHIILMLLGIVMIGGCFSYHTWNLAYFEYLESGQWEQANESLYKNQYLKKPRNKLLSNLEKGRLSFLEGKHQTSVELLESADIMIEDFKRSISKEALALITNDEKRAYKAERYESMLVNYYKALNFIFLNDLSASEVEARKITIKQHALEDKKVDKAYFGEPMALNMQGMIYETNRDYNNAFISYRNAVETYLKAGGAHFGTPLPNQLGLDAMRTAKILGFHEDLSYLEKQLNIKYQSKPIPSGGYGILFIETGMGPIKGQEYFTFIATRKDRGVFVFNCDALDLILPIPVDMPIRENEIITVAFPKYNPRGSFFNKVQILNANNAPLKEQPELFANITVLAIQGLKNRYHKEIGKAVLRLATKKIAEYQLRDGNEGLGAVLGGINALTEKADTRSWQSLPDRIMYVRIPLEKGENTFTLELTDINEGMHNHNVTFTGKEKGRLQFKNISFLAAKYGHLQ